MHSPRNCARRVKSACLCVSDVAGRGRPGSLAEAAAAAGVVVAVVEVLPKSTVADSWDAAAAADSVAAAGVVAAADAVAWVGR